MWLLSAIYMEYRGIKKDVYSKTLPVMTRPVAETLVRLLKKGIMFRSEDFYMEYVSVCDELNIKCRSKYQSLMTLSKAGLVRKVRIAALVKEMKEAGYTKEEAYQLLNIKPSPRQKGYTVAKRRELT